MAYLTLKDGVPIFYTDQGKGTPIVLIQGLMWTSSYFWQKNLPALAAKHRVIALDLRGQGLSGKPLGPFTLDQCAKDLKEVLDTLDIRDATLVGLAFGVLLALHYYRDYGRHRIAKLVLMEGTPRLTLTTGWEHATFGNYTIEGGAGFVAAAKADRGVLKAFLQSAFPKPLDDATLAAMNAETYLTPTETVCAYIEDMTAADYRDVVGKVDLPTLLIYGRCNNPVLPTELGRWMQSQIPGSCLELFSESAHAPFWDEPERFNRVILAFAAQ